MKENPLNFLGIKEDVPKVSSGRNGSEYLKSIIEEQNRIVLKKEEASSSKIHNF